MTRGPRSIFYDARNPTFKASQGAPRTAQHVGAAQRDHSLLRSESWQSLAGLLDSAGGCEDLLVFIKDKYVIVAEGSPSDGVSGSPPTIHLDANPIGAHWTKVVHWDRILSNVESLESFRVELKCGGFTPDEFR